MIGAEGRNHPWSAIPPARRDAMRRRFAALLAADLLAEPDEPPPLAAKTRPVRFDELYEAASNPTAPIAPRVANALEAGSGGPRAEFEALLEANAAFWFPVAAAASGEEGLDRREASGARIDIRPSAAGEGQVYVLVRTEDGARHTKPVALVAVPPNGPPLRAPLPEDIEGVHQLIEHEDSALVRALRDPASKLALQ